MRLLSILLLSATVAFCDELPMVAPIVIPNQVKLAWDANDPADNVTEYTVYLTTNDSLMVFTSSINTLFSLNLSLYSLEPQRIVAYVTASNSAGESEPSNWVSYVYSSTECLFGDYDYNGEVNGLDLMMFWNSFWCTKGVNKDYNSIFDYDQDGFIGGIDHEAMVLNFYEKLPQE